MERWCAAAAWLRFLFFRTIHAVAAASMKANDRNTIHHFVPTRKVVDDNVGRTASELAMFTIISLVIINGVMNS